MSDDDASEMSGLWRGIMSAELTGGVLFAVLAAAAWLLEAPSPALPVAAGISLIYFWGASLSSGMIERCERRREEPR